MKSYSFQHFFLFYLFLFVIQGSSYAQKQELLKKMVLIKGGEYKILSKKITFQDFYIDETPITYNDFEVYVKAGGKPSLYWHYSVYNQPDHPVTGLSWYQAVDFCNWRSRIEGYEPAYKPSKTLDFYGYPVWELDEKANGYRLPTEAEFELCAKSGKDTPYAWGSIFVDSLANYDQEKGKKTSKWWRLAKVREGYQTAWGLYGMAGNIWHWTTDWYEPLNSKSSKTLKTKVLRGGSWGSVSAEELKTTARSFTAPSHYNFDIGFRCVRPKKSENKPKKPVLHNFYEFSFSQKPLLETDFFEKKDDNRLIKVLAIYLHDHFPNSLYFKQTVDQQKIMTAEELAELIVTESNRLKINPLFLFGVMAAETAVGSCSFSRWYNNPMAYHWQNRLMEAGEPVYEDLPNKRNRKYRTLSEGFEAFGQGIQKPIYYEAAKKTLADFHHVYVGYEAKDWIFTISKIYKDITGIDFTENTPSQNAGQYIYQDWEKINPAFQAKKGNQETNWQEKEKKYALIYGSYGSENEAIKVLEKYKNEGLANAQILVTNGRFRLALEQHETEGQAIKRLHILKKQFPEIWLLRR